MLPIFFAPYVWAKITYSSEQIPKGKNVPPFEILIACTFAVAAFDYWGSIVNTCLTS